MHGDKYDVMETYWSKFALSVPGNIELEWGYDRARDKNLWVIIRMTVKFIRDDLPENKHSTQYAENLERKPQC